MEGLAKKQAIEEKLQAFEQLRQELEDAKQQAQINAEANKVVNQMIDQGFVEVDQEGNIIPSQQVAKSQESFH